VENEQQREWFFSKKKIFQVIYIFFARK